MASNSSVVVSTPAASVGPSTISSFISTSDVVASSAAPQSSSSSSSSSTSETPSSIATSETPTSVVTVSSAPPTTFTSTSIVTHSNAPPSTVIVTITSSGSKQTIVAATSSTDSSSSAATSTPAAALQGDHKGSGGSSGLSAGGKTAIAVVIPVVVVALLVLGGIFLWRKRKQRKTAEEARRKEVEEYGFNPNTDPTLPAVAGGPEMAEDTGGYRGWGNTTSSARNPSTTLSGGHTQLSDSGSNPGGYQSPGSPIMPTGSDGQSADPLMGNRRETMDSETIGALGAAPAANTNRSDIHRGPSNASSSYSAANHSDNSGDAPIPVNGPQDYYQDNGYYQQGPYDNSYGGQQQPIIRDVQARRNTRIENPSVFPQQGNSGISANF